MASFEQGRNRDLKTLQGIHDHAHQVLVSLGSRDVHDELEMVIQQMVRLHFNFTPDENRLMWHRCKWVETMEYDHIRKQNSI